MPADRLYRFIISPCNWGEEIEIRCFVCGRSKEFESASLAELDSWATEHKCPVMRVD